MDESQIAEQQKQNIPKPTEHTPAPDTPGDTGFGNAQTGLDELVQYKMSDIFGERYNPNDEIARQQMQYIYDKVSEMIDNKDYAFVAAKARELMRIAGITHNNNQRYRLYQWLKLENIMKRTNAEMNALRDA